MIYLSKKGQKVKAILEEDLEKIWEYLFLKNKIPLLEFINFDCNVVLQISDLSRIKFQDIDEKNWKLELIERKTKKKRVIRYPIGSHSLRKTWGKRVYDKTQNIALVMKALNHSSPSATLRYIGIEQEEIEQLYEEIEI